MGTLSFKPKTFCWFFSVQAGVVFISTILLTLCVIIAVYNISAPNCGHGASSIISHLFVYLWIALMVVCLTLALLSVFTERRGLLVWAYRLLIAGTIFWGVLTTLSLINSKDLNDHVCLSCRCGEHLWILDARWRRCGSRCEKERRIGAVSFDYAPPKDRRPAVRRDPDKTEEVERAPVLKVPEYDVLREEEYEQVPSYDEKVGADSMESRGEFPPLVEVPRPGRSPALERGDDFDVYERDEEDWIRSQRPSPAVYCGLIVWSYTLFFVFLGFLTYSILIFAAQEDNMLGIL